MSYSSQAAQVFEDARLSQKKSLQIATARVDKWKGGREDLYEILSELAWIRIHNCDKLFTDILLGLNPVDKYDMTSEILFLFEVYPEVQELTKYIVLLELEY